MTGPHEIGNISPTLVSHPNPEPTRTSSPPPPNAPLSSTQQDPVALSTLTRELESIRNAIARLPAIRLERLDQIRHDLSSGNYRIPSEQIADRIIQETIRNSKDLP